MWPVHSAPGARSKAERCQFAKACPERLSLVLDSCFPCFCWCSRTAKERHFAAEPFWSPKHFIVFPPCQRTKRTLARQRPSLVWPSSLPQVSVSGCLSPEPANESCSCVSAGAKRWCQCNAQYRYSFSFLVWFSGGKKRAILAYFKFLQGPTVRRNARLHSAPRRACLPCLLVFCPLCLPQSLTGCC